jgi:hypothetical protein
LEGTDYLFPYVSSNGMIHPKRPMTHDTVPSSQRPLGQINGMCTRGLCVSARLKLLTSDPYSVTLLFQRKKSSYTAGRLRSRQMAIMVYDVPPRCQKPPNAW